MSFLIIKHISVEGGVFLNKTLVFLGFSPGLFLIFLGFYHGFHLEKPTASEEMQRLQMDRSDHRRRFRSAEGGRCLGVGG